jgi:hypothetical protein
MVRAVLNSERVPWEIAAVLHGGGGEKVPDVIEGEIVEREEGFLAQEARDE